MADLLEYLRRAVEDHASDVFIVAGGPVREKLDKRLIAFSEEPVFPKDTEQLILELYALAGRDSAQFFQQGDDDFSLSIRDLARFRVNTYRQRGSLAALRSCLRQAPDVILLGEMRDQQTIYTAMTAAETGHLLIATLHTQGAVNTIDRIVDAFPSGQQGQVRVQLSMVLRTVVSQQLLPGSIPACC